MWFYCTGQHCLHYVNHGNSDPPSLPLPSLKKMESPLKYQHRCVSVFKNQQGQPSGYALGSIEGRVAIQYINPPNPWVLDQEPQSSAWRILSLSGLGITSPSSAIARWLVGQARLKIYIQWVMPSPSPAKIIDTLSTTQVENLAPVDNCSATVQFLVPTRLMT